jgi:mono/diheme cytochrome c family protein
MSYFIRIAVSAVIGLAMLCAAPGGTPKGNETKGKYYFKQTCKECHTKGAKGGEVSPLTKTMAQWRTYFTKGKHAGGAEPLTKFMPDGQLNDVQTFLVNHAADSLQPETCGK